MVLSETTWYTDGLLLIGLALYWVSSSNKVLVVRRGILFINSYLGNHH